MFFVISPITIFLFFLNGHGKKKDLNGGEKQEKTK